MVCEPPVSAQRTAPHVTRPALPRPTRLTLRERGFLHVLEELAAESRDGRTIERHGPDLVAAAETSLSTVVRNLAGLEAAGYITRERSTHPQGASRITLVYVPPR